MCSEARARTAVWSRWPGTHCQIPVKPGARPVTPAGFPVDIFEYAFDRVPAMGVETARLTPLPRWRA